MELFESVPTSFFVLLVKVIEFQLVEIIGFLVRLILQGHAVGELT